LPLSVLHLWHRKSEKRNERGLAAMRIIDRPQKQLRNRVDLSSPELARRWCKRLGASQAAIEVAIAKVGDNVETVVKELRSK